MDLREKAALLDFFDSVIWPGRVSRLVSTVGGERDFVLPKAWNVTYDTPMAWVDGNRITAAITWNSTTSVRLPSTVAVGSLVLILISPGAGSNYLARNSGTAGLLADLDCGSFRLKKIHASVDPDDAIQRQEVVDLVASMLGTNYVLKTGDTMTGALVVLSASAASHPTRMEQVPLLNGTQAFTAEQKGVAAATATGFVTKAQMDTAIAAAVGAILRPPNMYQEFLTPGAAFTFEVPDDVTLIYAELASGAGASGVGDTLSAGYLGGAAGTAKVFALPVTPGEVLTVRVGGGGYIGNIGIFGWRAGGGGGNASSLTGVAGTVLVGGGGGGFGGGSGIGGSSGTVGGSGGANGGDYAPGEIVGGLAGTAGAGTASGGVGGSVSSSATTGAFEATPSSLLDNNVDWAFPVPTAPAATPLRATNGGHGHIKLRWFAP